MRKIPALESPFLLDLETFSEDRGDLNGRDLRGEALSEGALDDRGRRNRWIRAFEADRPLRIEVGVGNSPFLVEVAQLEPDFNYLGFEYSRKRVLKFLKKVEGAGVTNIRMVQHNAEPILDRSIGPGDIDHLFVNFPDPWPKRKHSKKRFVRDDRMRAMGRLLRMGGGVSLRTDEANYAQQMLEVMDGLAEFENLSGTGRFADEPKYPFPTAYEIKFLREGRRIHYLEYVKRNVHNALRRDES